MAQSVQRLRHGWFALSLLALLAPGKGAVARVSFGGGGFEVPIAAPINEAAAKACLEDAERKLDCAKGECRGYQPILRQSCSCESLTNPADRATEPGCRLARPTKEMVAQFEVALKQRQKQRAEYEQSRKSATALERKHQKMRWALEDRITERRRKQEDDRKKSERAEQEKDQEVQDSLNADPEARRKWSRQRDDARTASQRGLRDKEDQFSDWMKNERRQLEDEIAKDRESERKTTQEIY